MLFLITSVSNDRDCYKVVFCLRAVIFIASNVKFVRVRYTSKKSFSGVSVYAISLAWPKNGELILGAVRGTAQTTVTMLGYKDSLKWDSRAPAVGIVVHVPAIHENEMPCQWAWTFKLDNVE